MANVVSPSLAYSSPPASPQVASPSFKLFDKDLRQLSTATSSQWKLKLQKLQKFCSILQSAGPDFHLRRKEWIQFKDPLRSSLSDLRSALVKGAADLICVIATIKSSLPLMNALFPILLQALGTGNTVTFDYYNQCLLTILYETQCQNKTTFQCVVDDLLQRNIHNQKLRARLLEFLGIFLSNETLDLKTHFTTIESILIQALQDPTPEARAKARKCFSYYSLQHKHRAHEYILSKVPLQTQKKIMGEYSQVLSPAKTCDAPTLDVMNAPSVQIGQRIRLRKNGLRGIVRFLGMTSFSPGEWIGVELDHKAGKHNGTLNSIKYFECPMNHGLFVRPEHIDIEKELLIDAKSQQNTKATESLDIELNFDLSQEQTNAFQKFMDYHRDFIHKMLINCQVEMNTQEKYLENPSLNNLEYVQKVDELNQEKRQWVEELNTRLVSIRQHLGNNTE